MKKIIFIIICIMFININGCINKEEEKEKIAVESAGKSDQIKNFKFK